MAIPTYTGTGEVSASDYKEVKWVGKSKDGKAVTIRMKKAINLGNLDWTFKEKDDVVASLTFEGVYANTDAAASDTTEPWTLAVNGQSSGASEIVLGAGVFYVGGTAIALSRGGGQFVVEREFRPINADGDRGTVEGRVVEETAKPKLTMNALTFLTRVADLYPGITTTTMT